MEFVLEVKNLTKKFPSKGGDFTAVDNISFSMADGEILGLLGPNGAGKTTTIHMLLGVMLPTNGKISYFDKDFVSYREEILRLVNFSSGYISLPWHLTIEEILDVYARLYEIPDKKKRIIKLLGIFEIEDMFKKKFYQLSAGEKSRVLLVKAFLNYPRIILLDEPTAALDPDIAKKVRQFLKTEKDEFNVSMLFTSHNMAEVEEMCDRVIFINQGKIIKEGTPSSIAREIRDCHLQMMITENIEKAITFSNKLGFATQQEKSYLTITLPEKQIANFLNEFAKENINYEEISIEKPNLEDFFLKMTGSKNA